MTAAPVYHEKQQLARCAVHALNNLLQEEAFNANLLDDIAHNLTPGNVLALNPHKSVLGIGNYDLNVIEKALDSIGLCFKWLRPTETDLLTILHCNDVGFLINRPAKEDSVWKLLVSKVTGVSAHWFAARQVHGTWYDLDSKLDRPRAFASETELLQWLQTLRESPDVHILRIFRNPHNEPSLLPAPSPSASSGALDPQAATAFM